MPRLPYAAKTLINEVQEAKPRSKAGERTGEVDGLGVYRTIRFNKSVGDWLRPILEFLDDKRIASLEDGDSGALEVTFIAGPKADDKDIFMLKVAESVLKG